MILGPGPATSEEAIFAEFPTLLTSAAAMTTPHSRHQVIVAVQSLRRLIAKPLSEWTKTDMHHALSSHSRSTGYAYALFITFVLLRGYRQSSVAFVMELPVVISRIWEPGLREIRQRLVQSCAESDAQG